MNETERKIDNARFKAQLICGILVFLTMYFGLGFFTFFFVIGFIFFS